MCTDDVINALILGCIKDPDDGPVIPDNGNPTPTPPYTCDANSYFCDETGNECIQPSKECDFNQDCTNNSDERNCRK